MKKFIQSLKLIAKGYMLKTSSAAEILNSIRRFTVVKKLSKQGGQ